MTEKRFRGRPFASYLLSREIRRVGRQKYNGKQFTADQWNTFTNKTRTAAALLAVWDMVEKADDDFKISDMWPWLDSNWRAVRAAIDKSPLANSGAPELFYDCAPRGRGRKARKAMPPGYQTINEFAADKEATLKQIEHEKNPPKPVPIRASRPVTEVAQPMGTKKSLDAASVRGDG